DGKCRRRRAESASPLVRNDVLPPGRHERPLGRGRDGDRASPRLPRAEPVGVLTSYSLLWHGLPTVPLATTEGLLFENPRPSVGRSGRVRRPDHNRVLTGPRLLLHLLEHDQVILLEELLLLPDLFEPGFGHFLLHHLLPGPDVAHDPVGAFP